MEDKEIIIDGVDVAGCEFYQIEANELYPKAQYCGSMRNTFCENEPNCYYKQLQRLQFELKITKADYEASEQENAELKAYKDVNEDFKTAWEELKAENEWLKEELKNNELEYQLELNTYNIEGGNLLEENKQLWQTLQEIKTIAEAPKPFIIDFPETKTATEVEYNYAAVCNELELRLYKVLELITKAEEE